MPPTPPDDANRKKAHVEAKIALLMQDDDDAATVKSTLKTGGVKLKDLVDKVAETTGGKKAELKATVEATLDAIGTFLATGNDLNIPPLGKLRIAKNKPPVMTLKLRLADGAKAAGLALADEDEDS